MKTEIYHRWNLTRRLVVLVVVIVALSLGLFALLTALRLAQGARVQELAVAELAKERTNKQLRLQAQLFAGELRQIKTQTKNSMSTLAYHQDTHRILARGNIVAIDRLLRVVVETSQMDGVLAFDRHLNALGSHRPGLVLAKVNRVFSTSKLAVIGRGIILGNDRRNPFSHTGFQAENQEFLKTMGINAKSDQMVIADIHPVFDDFGDVTAVLLGYRMVRASEVAFERLMEGNSLGVQILNGSQVLMEMGNIFEENLAGIPVHAARNGITSDGSYLFQCQGFNIKWRLCIFQTIGELNKLTSSFVEFIQEEKNSLLLWLGAVAVVSILLAAIIATRAIKRVMAPLDQIARAVRSVAKGNWLAHVSGQKRRDEVGDIARAVAVLQRSMKDRESLKADVADINQLRVKQCETKEAAQTFRSSLRQHIYGLLEITQNVESKSQNVISLSLLAKSEADEARLVTGRYLSKTRDEVVNGAKRQAEAEMLRESIDRFSNTATNIGNGSRELLTIITSINQEMRGLEKVVKELMLSISNQQLEGAEDAKQDTLEEAA